MRRYEKGDFIEFYEDGIHAIGVIVGFYDWSSYDYTVEVIEIISGESVLLHDCNGEFSDDVGFWVLDKNVIERRESGEFSAVSSESLMEVLNA